MGKVGKYTVENRVRATDFIVGHDENGNVKRFRGKFFLRDLANDSAYLAMLDDEVEARIAGDALLDDKIDLTKINIEALISGLEGDITTIQGDLMSVNGQIQGLATQFNNELYGVGGIVENYTALINNTETSLKSYIDQADAALAVDYNGKISGLYDAIDFELFVGGQLDIDLLVSRFNSSPSTAQFRGSYININPSVTFSEGYDPSEKSRVFKFTPPHPPYDIDDLRISSDGDLFVANTKRTAGQAYVDSDWTLALRYIGMYELNNALSDYATKQWVTENFSSGGGVNPEDWFSLIKPDPEDSSTWYVQTNYSLTSVKEIQAWTDNGQLPPTVWDSIPDATTTSKGVVQIGNGINVSNGVISLDQSTITPQTLSLSGNNLTISGGNTVDLGTVLPDLSWENITGKPATATRWPSWSEVTSKPIELEYLDGVTSGIQAQLNSKLNASVFSDMFELVTTANGSYIRAKYGLASDFELTAYADSGQSLPSIFDNLPKASTGAYGVVKIGSNIDVTDGVISVSGDALNPTLGFVNNILSVNASTVDLSSLETDLSDYYTKTQTNSLLNNKANKNGSSTEDFTVKNLTIHGTVNHWLADVITVDDAKLQLNRSQGGATVESGIDIWNGSSVVASIDYSVAGNWVFNGGEIYQGATKVALQNVSINAGNGLTGGGNLTTNRTITLGTPSTITNSTTNSVSSTSHTHELDISDIPSKGTLDAETLRSIRAAGLYTYRMVISNTGHPSGSNYGSVINWGHGTLGSVQLYGGWASTSKNRLWVRSLRDTIDNWTDWTQIYTDNYHPLADSATNALSLGGYSASSYPRKAENAVITGAWKFSGGSNYKLTIQHSITVDAIPRSASLVLGRNASYHIWRMSSQSTQAWGNFPDLHFENKTTEAGAWAKRVTILSNGNVGINNAAPTERLHVAGNGLFTGNLTAQGEVTAYSSSDRRLKSNIKPITSALDIIEGLNPVSFNWNKKAIALNSIKDDVRTNYGVIAQEVEKILPDLVHQTNGYKSVDYIQMIGILLAGVRELNYRINNLEKVQVMI